MTNWVESAPNYDQTVQYWFQTIVKLSNISCKPRGTTLTTTSAKTTHIIMSIPNDNQNYVVVTPKDYYNMWYQLKTTVVLATNDSA